MNPKALSTLLKASALAAVVSLLLFAGLMYFRGAGFPSLAVSAGILIAGAVVGLVSAALAKGSVAFLGRRKNPK